MSTIVVLEILSLDDSESICISLQSRFYRDLIDPFESTLRTQRLQEQLTKDEWQILEAQYIEASELFERIAHEPGIDPRAFSSALRSLVRDLQNNAHLYPKEFMLNGQYRTTSFQSGDQRCYVEGFSNDLKYPSHVKLTCIDAMVELHETMLPITPEQETLTIGELRFNLKEHSMYQRYEYDIERMLDLCERALSNSNNVMWYIIV